MKLPVAVVAAIAVSAVGGGWLSVSATKATPSDSGRDPEHPEDGARRRRGGNGGLFAWNPVSRWLEEALEPRRHLINVIQFSRPILNDVVSVHAELDLLTERGKALVDEYKRNLDNPDDLRFQSSLILEDDFLRLHQIRRGLLHRRTETIEALHLIAEWCNKHIDQNNLTKTESAFLHQARGPIDDKSTFFTLKRLRNKLDAIRDVFKRCPLVQSAHFELLFLFVS